MGVFAVFACTCSQFPQGSPLGAAFSGFRPLCGLSSARVAVFRSSTESANRGTVDRYPLSESPDSVEAGKENNSQ